MPIENKVLQGTEDVIKTDDLNEVFTIKKDLISSNVVQAGVDITGVSSVGELIVENIILKTDGTGLGAGTNLEITSDNDDGVDNIMVETVANLGTNATVDLSGASVSGVQTVLEVGKKLIANTTVADATGAGVLTIYVTFRRLTDKATIAAA